MGNEPDSVYFEYQDVVHYPYLLAADELHFSLVAQYIYLQADAFTFIHMSGLGEELDVERLAFHLPRRLRMHVASYLLTAAWVYPLPLFAKLAKVLIRLLISCHGDTYLSVYKCLHVAAEVVIITMDFLLHILCIRRHLGMQETVQDDAFYLSFLLGYPLSVSQYIWQTDIF